MSKTISQLQEEITAWGKSKGWDKPPLCKTHATPISGTVLQNDPTNVDVQAVLAKLALVHTEVSEAVEAVRDDHYALHWSIDSRGQQKPEGMVTELADTVIRCIHLAGLLGLDLEGAIEIKMAYNQGREHMHGGRKA